MGALDETQTYLTKSLHEFNEVNGKNGIIYSLECFASLAVQREQPERAASLFAVADRLREEIYNPRPLSEQADVEKDIAVSLTRIDQDTYVAAYTAGRAMPSAEAVAYALSN
jgi:hypothetical protein